MFVIHPVNCQSFEFMNQCFPVYSIRCLLITHKMHMSRAHGNTLQTSKSGIQFTDTATATKTAMLCGTNVHPLPIWSLQQRIFSKANHPIIIIDNIFDEGNCLDFWKCRKLFPRNCMNQGLQQ